MLNQHQQKTQQAETQNVKSTSTIIIRFTKPLKLVQKTQFLTKMTLYGSGYERDLSDIWLSQGH